MRQAQIIAVASAALLFGCPSTDSRCNVDNCKILMTQCGIVFQADPNFGLCFTAADGGEPAGFQDGGFAAYCPASCNATRNGGATLQCFVDHQVQCGSLLDGGQAAVFSECAPSDAGMPDPACTQRCTDARTACDQGCAKPDFNACMSCSSSCGVTEASCINACPVH
jgi:hypothetical protein